MKIFYLIFFILLCILHGLNGFFLNIIPFMFLDPTFKCENGICSQAEACETKYTYEAAGFGSITSEFGLICENRFWKPLMIMLVLTGTSLTGIFFSFYSIKSKNRGHVILIGFFTSAIFAGISTCLYDLKIVAIFLFLYYVGNYCWYANIYAFVNERYPSEYRKILPSILSASYGVGTMAFAGLSTQLLEWRSLTFYFLTVPTTIVCFITFVFTLFFKFKEDALMPTLPIKEMGILDLFKDSQLKWNALIYLFMWNMNSLSYAGCDISLGSLAIDLRYSIFFLGFIQALCCSISGYLLTKFNSELLIKITTVWMTIFFLAFFFEPQDKHTVSSTTRIIFTIFMIMANLGIELNWSILVNLMQNYIPPSAQQNVFSFGDTLSMIIALGIPYYIDGMLFIGLSPILGFGLLTIIGRLLLNFLGDKWAEHKKSISGSYKKLELI